MKILLLKPPASVSFNAVTPPLGMMCISAFLKQHGYRDVKLIHMDVEQMGFDEVKNIILNYSPDIIGLSVIISEAKNMYKVSALAKNALPKTLIVAGGAYPTAYVENCLRCPDIDVVVRGEGEESFLELIRRYEQGLPFTGTAGISFRKDGQIENNKTRPFIDNLDVLPHPDWNSINIPAYRNFYPQSPFAYKERYMTIHTSRGCPYRCTFCHNVMGKDFRSHSSVRVFEEISILYHQYDIRHFNIQDDTFNLDRERARDIMKEIIKSKMKLQMYFPNGVRGDILDEETIDLFKQAGVVYMCIGIEAGTVKMQNKIRKFLDLGKTKKIINYARKKRIFSNGFFILGFPGESLSDIFKTIIYACFSGLHTASFFVLHLYKGTEMGYSLSGKLAINERDVSTSYAFGDYFVNYSDISRPVLILMRRLANFFFYMNPVRMYWIIRDLPNTKVLKILISKFISRTILSL